MRTRMSFALVLILFVSMSGCATSRKTAPHHARKEKFEEVGIGDSESKVIQLWGSPTESVERFGTAEYRLLQYGDNSGIPVAMFALDPNSQLVAGKAKWVPSQNQESDLEYALATKFAGTSFKTYIPCETRSPKDEILVSREAGLFLFRRKEHLLLISWADPRLTNLRIEQFYKQCPKLQIEK